MSSNKWEEEKLRLLSLPLEEKRKNYMSLEYITVDEIEPWTQHYIEYKDDIDHWKYTDKDVEEFNAMITIDKQKNENVASRVSLVMSDITYLEVDAIVNPTNPPLKVISSVDHTINSIGGPYIKGELKSLGHCNVGNSVVTGGYRLPAKNVMHTYIPKPRRRPGLRNMSHKQLENCYKSSLVCAKRNLIKSIAFPCMSTRFGGFSNLAAAHIALGTVRKFLEQNDCVERVIFCTFLPIDYDIYETLMLLYFPVES